MAETPQRWRDDVRGAPVYPGTGPWPAGAAVISPSALGHPEQRRRGTGSSAGPETAALVAGRALFGGYFLYNGLNHLTHRSELAGYARRKGVPAPDAAVTGSGLLILFGGLSLLAGLRPKAGAASIVAFLLGVSPVMHAFWRERDPDARAAEQVNFTKNMALVGAAFLAAAHPGPWPWRVATPRTARPRHPGTARSEALVAVSR
jgi:uncharacterized membrane protein YphA (DoxX/SURF4 family)